ncbi:SIMPL domain-containing protein [Candidatus Dojkabacteria bacterium]|nr:SIMPL domain-containing protein [Candidatus Dojkabacteria bacterium]
MIYFLRQTTKSFLQFAVKAVLVFGLVIAVIFIGTMVFFKEAQGNLNVDRTFSVSGTAKKMVTPDIAELTVGTIVQGKEINMIQDEATQKINNATEKIKSLEIPSEDIQTINYNLTPEKKINSNEIESYTVNIAIKITLRNTEPKDEMVGNVIEAATSAGLNEVRSLYFKVDNEETILDELKLEAIENAKERGKILSSEAGLKLGKLINMSEGYGSYSSYSNYPYEPRVPENAAISQDILQSDGNPIVQIQPGQFELSTIITLLYETR